jgi:hypothetical protein
MANALQHHLAWCLCLVTGARGGSIGCSQGYEGFMKWRDIRIVRDLERKGAFVVKCRFEFWKGFSEEIRDL